MFMKQRCAMTSFDFSFFSFYFLVVQKVEFSHLVQYSTSPKYPYFPDLLYSSYIVCMVDGKNVVLATARMQSRRRMFGPGEEFLGAQSTTIFFFFLINGSSKESKPPEAHKRIFFLSLLLLPMTRVNPIELFFTDSFFFFSSSKSPCGNLDYLTGLLYEAMSSSQKLRRKSLTVIIILGGRLERRKELVDRFESSLR